VAAEAFGSATLRRVEWLSLTLGGLGTAWAAWHWGWRGGLGLAIGAVLSWINFRWLKGSVFAFGQAATIEPSGVQNAPVPKSAYLEVHRALRIVARGHLCYSDPLVVSPDRVFCGLVCIGCGCGYSVGL
jgi:hypothetical protein